MAYALTIKNIVINWDQLPLHIIYKGAKGKKEYILRANNDRTKILLNKKED